jgi:hypothetical protein
MEEVDGDLRRSHVFLPSFLEDVLGRVRALNVPIELVLQQYDYREKPLVEFWQLGRDGILGSNDHQPNSQLRTSPGTNIIGHSLSAPFYFRFSRVLLSLPGENIPWCRTCTFPPARKSCRGTGGQEVLLVENIIDPEIEREFCVAL